MIKHLERPTLVAPSMDALVQYASDIRAYNKAACRAVDEATPTNFALPGKRGAKTGREIALANTKTLHDYLGEHPELARAYKRSGFAALGLK